MTVISSSKDETICVSEVKIESKKDKEIIKTEEFCPTQD